MRGGSDAELFAKDGTNIHTLVPVYTLMLRQVCLDYPGLPDPRTLTTNEIRWFYEGIRSELKRTTKPK